MGTPVLKCGMRIFDDGTRTDSSPMARAESAFGFLNRSARPEFEEVRRLIEDWGSRYPDDHTHELRERLRSGKDADHNAAVFELFLHELLMRLGWSVEVHPTIPGTRRSPDFLATLAGERILVEATEVRPQSSLSATDPLEDRVLDAIDRLHSPNFFLHVTTQGHLVKAPPLEKVVAPFEELMSAHDPDEVAAEIKLHGPEASPARRVEFDGWSIKASLMPKFNARGDGSTRTIGTGPMRMSWTNGSKPVRDALRAKARSFGRTGLPLIVAVNAPDVDDIDETEALFGKEQVTFTFTGDPDLSQPRMTRAPDGVWIGPGYKPLYTRLSAALIFRGVAPWFLRAPTCLYVNPFAERPVPRAALALPHALCANGELVRKAGVDVAEILGAEPIHRGE